MELATKRRVAVIVVNRNRIGSRQYGMVVALLILLAGVTAHAQDTLSIGVQSTLPAFQLVSNPANTTATNNLVVLTNWNITSVNSAKLSVCVYMTGPMTGTGNNTDTIAASSVRVNGSSIVTGSTSCGVASAFPVVTGSHIWTNGPAADSRLNGWRSDTLPISISGYSNNLEPDTYTGSINLIVSVQ